MSPTLPLFASATNFRDLALQVHPRVPLKPRTIFRSDHLGALTPQDAAQIQALGLRRVIDFRGTREREAAACALPGVQVHSLAIEPTIVQVLQELLAAGHRLTGADVAAHMQDTYRGFVRHNTRRFAEFFELLLASSEPTVFHCTAGKDRTGFAAALLLHTLGATDEEILRDYMLTNERLAHPPGTALGLSPEVAQVLWSVQPGFLQAALDAVAQDHGSLDAYLERALGLSPSARARLRALYLAG